MSMLVCSPTLQQLTACNGARAQAAAELLSKWAIFRVGAPAAAGAAPAALAPQEAWAYVLKARAQAERPTDFERQAMERSCAALFDEVHAPLAARAAMWIVCG